MTNREKFEAEIRSMNDADFLNVIVGQSGKLRYFDKLCKWCKSYKLHGRDCREGDECCDFEFLRAEAKE